MMMKHWPKQPVIYEINTWVWLNELGQKYGRSVDLGSVPSQEWESLALLKMDAVWFMGVWERSPAAVRLIPRLKEQMEEFHRILPDFAPQDVIGSAYCIRRYIVDERIGGPMGLAAARKELAGRGIRLVLDFVPNHTAQDHPWVSEHPEYYIQGGADDLAIDPTAYFEADGKVIACGRDPFFPAWQDVAQLNAFHAGLRKAAIETIESIAEQCDGIRCDMAMLLINGIFENTWGKKAGKRPRQEYWVQIIEAVLRKSLDFVFIAEAYWDLEWELQQQGFDFCYDKRLYDRLTSGTAEDVRLHLLADAGYQRKLLRFIENHDEPRATAVFHPQKELAAALIVATVPGAKLFHDGQIEGRKIRVPVSIGRRPPEEPQTALQDFYRRLLDVVSSACFHEGEWKLCDREGWPDNSSCINVLAWCWRWKEERYLIAVNFSDFRSQSLIRVPWQDIGGAQWRLLDVVGGGHFDRDGGQMQFPGLYVDLEGRQWHFLKFSKAGDDFSREDAMARKQD
ncbi:MAG: alpha-amylase family glycosyl hydrolase [Syntrophobacteraceae bacterium]